MPYSTLTAKGNRQWEKVYQGQKRRGLSEGRAARSAWAAVRKTRGARKKQASGLGTGRTGDRPVGIADGPAAPVINVTKPKTTYTKPRTDYMASPEQKVAFIHGFLRQMGDDGLTKEARILTLRASVQAVPAARAALGYHLMKECAAYVQEIEQHCPGFIKQATNGEQPGFLGRALSAFKPDFSTPMQSAGTIFKYSPVGMPFMAAQGLYRGAMGAPTHGVTGSLGGGVTAAGGATAGGQPTPQQLAQQRWQHYGYDPSKDPRLMKTWEAWTPEQRGYWMGTTPLPEDTAAQQALGKAMGRSMVMQGGYGVEEAKKMMAQMGEKMGVSPGEIPTPEGGEWWQKALGFIQRNPYILPLALGGMGLLGGGARGGLMGGGLGLLGMFLLPQLLKRFGLGGGEGGGAAPTPRQMVQQQMTPAQAQREAGRPLTHQERAATGQWPYAGPIT